MWPRPPGRLHLVGPEFRFFKDKTTLMWCSSQTRNHFQKFRVEHTPRKILTKKIPKKMGFWNKYHLSNHESWLFGSIYVRVSRVFFLTPTIMVQWKMGRVAKMIVFSLKLVGNFPLKFWEKGVPVWGMELLKLPGKAPEKWRVARWHVPESRPAYFQWLM